MKKWQAISDIIKSFNDNGAPGYGLIAFLAVLLISAALVVFFVLAGLPELAGQLADSAFDVFTTPTSDNV